MPADIKPIDIEERLTNPQTYEDAILRIFRKKSQRGLAFNTADRDVTYLSTATQRRTLAQAIARSVANGQYQPQPVTLRSLEIKGKRRTAHLPTFTDHVVGSALYQLLSHNARCYGLPGVYSYLPGLTNVTAMQDFARFVRAQRKQFGRTGPPLYVLQSDFERYGDDLPIGTNAALWNILRHVVELGHPHRTIGPHAWNLITSLARPVVHEPDGTQFTRLNGVAMGTPLVPVLENLAVTPIDAAISTIDGIFYARYNDDFIVAHPQLDAVYEAENRINALLEGLGVKRKYAKEHRIALSGNGQPSVEDPTYRGRDRIDCLGLTVSHAGTVSLGRHLLRRFIGRVARRIDAAAPALSSLPTPDRAHYLVQTTNVMLDPESPFAVAGLSALLKLTTDRGVLKDLDFRIARKITQVATRTPGIRGFRQLSPAALHSNMGLVSLVQLRNLR